LAEFFIQQKNLLTAYLEKKYNTSKMASGFLNISTPEFKFQKPSSQICGI